MKPPRPGLFRMLAACAALVVLASACTSASPPDVTHTTGGTGSATGSGSTPSDFPEAFVTMTVAGEQRRYLIQLPNPRPQHRPLIVFMHGAGNSPGGVQAQLDFTQTARQADAILVYPAGDPVHHSWRAGCCGPWANSPDDFLFVTRIIHSLVASGEVDPKEVALGGFSVGALFANTFACKYPTLVRGVLAIAGALLAPPASATHVAPGTPRCRPSHPITVLELHGSVDPAVPLAGSTSGCESFPCMTGTPGYLPSAASVDGWWRQLDGCSAPVRRSSGGATVQLAPCRDGTSVGLAVVPGVSHDLAGLVAKFPVYATLLQLATGRPLTAW